MRRLILLPLLLALSVFGLLSAPAQAITNGTYDQTNQYPYVGLMVAFDEDGAPLRRCSGTLISSTVYVTAGHCTYGAARVELFFTNGPITTDPTYLANLESGAVDLCAGVAPELPSYPCVGDVTGIPYTHPLYDDDAFYLHDLGVVVLDDEDEVVLSGGYASLPTLKQLDAFKASTRTRFTSVGYGLQRAFPDAAAWKEEAIEQRMVAHPYLLRIGGKKLGTSSIVLTNNAKTGGTCFGDSGGANFLGDTRTLAGVTSYSVNPTCAGTGGVYRIDQQDDLDFINRFITPL